MVCLSTKRRRCCRKERCFRLVLRHGWNILVQHVGTLHATMIISPPFFGWRCSQRRLDEAGKVFCGDSGGRRTDDGGRDGGHARVPQGGLRAWRLPEAASFD